MGLTSASAINRTTTLRTSSLGTSAHIMYSKSITKIPLRGILIYNNLFYVHVSVHRKNILIYIQQDATLRSLILSGNCSTRLHPKHVEQFPDKINCVTLHFLGYILEYNNLYSSLVSETRVSTSRKECACRPDEPKLLLFMLSFFVPVTFVCNESFSFISKFIKNSSMNIYNRGYTSSDGVVDIVTSLVTRHPGKCLSIPCKGEASRPDLWLSR